MAVNRNVRGPVPLARNMAPTSVDVTAPVALGSGSSVSVSATIVSGEANLALQWSDDRTNWAPLAAWASLEVGFHALPVVEGIAGGYVRVGVTSVSPPLVVGAVNVEVLPRDI